MDQWCRQQYPMGAKCELSNSRQPFPNGFTYSGGGERSTNVTSHNIISGVFLISLIKSWLTIKHTTTVDTAFNVISIDKWFNGVDIFVFTNDALFGDISDQEIILGVGETYSILFPVNLRELTFKNRVAGSNAKIVLAGVPMTNEQMKMQGVR